MVKPMFGEGAQKLARWANDVSVCDETRERVKVLKELASPRGDCQRGRCTARSAEDQNGMEERFRCVTRACIALAVAWRRGQAAVSMDPV